jgi:coenzyme F420 hydrogenase subunit beta
MLTNKKSSKIPTIEEVVVSNLCTGCGTCIGVCTRSAIKLAKIDFKGIYIPKINNEKCNHCGICYKICPGHEINFRDLNLKIFGKEPANVLMGNYLNCYTGYAVDYNIRYNSTSGGLVTQLLIFLLEEGMIDGALVTRMSKENPIEPEPFIAETREEIIEASRSKYCPVPANIALKKILDSEDGKKFAVVGLPCHINGIRKAELISKKLKERIILHIGIFCGTTKNFRGTRFQINRMGIKEKEIKNFDYRGEGWPGSLVIKLEGEEKKIIEPYYSYYDEKFCSFTPWRCTLCSDHTCELSDISFGDAWLSELAYDKIGTSVVVSRTKASSEILLNMASMKIIGLNGLDSSRAVLSQGMCRLKKNQLKARIYFSKLIGRKIPVFNQNILYPGFGDYLIAAWSYFWLFVASKSCLWSLFSVQDCIVKVIKHFRKTKRKHDHDKNIYI